MSTEGSKKKSSRAESSGTNNKPRTADNMSDKNSMGKSTSRRTAPPVGPPPPGQGHQPRDDKISVGSVGNDSVGSVGNDSVGSVGHNSVGGENNTKNNNITNSVAIAPSPSRDHSLPKPPVDSVENNSVGSVGSNSVGSVGHRSVGSVGHNSVGGKNNKDNNYKR